MRRWLPRTILPAMAFLVLAGCQRQSQMFSLASLQAHSPPTQEQLAALNLESYWELPLPLRTGERVARLYQLDENVYCRTTAGRAFALDAVVGLTRWWANVGDPHETFFAPCHANDVVPPKLAGTIIVPGRHLERAKTVNAVIVNTVKYALLFDRATGEELNRINFPFAANTSGSSDGTYFYVASVEGEYHSLRLNDGLVRWTMSTKDMIVVRPFYRNRTLYVASMDGTFSAINPEANTNRRLWMEATDGPLTANFFVNQRSCFVPSRDGKLYVLHRISGKERWKFYAQTSLADPVQVGRRTVFQYAEKDNFYALDVDTGKIRWKLPQGRLVLMVEGGTVYVLTPERTLLAVNENTGEITGKLDFRGFPLVVPNVAKPAIFACTAGGKVVCIRLAKSGRLTAEDLLDDRPEEIETPSAIPAP